jgi:hypothetical protein
MLDSHSYVAKSKSMLESHGQFKTTLPVWQVMYQQTILFQVKLKPCCEHPYLAQTTTPLVEASTFFQWHVLYEIFSRDYNTAFTAKLYHSIDVNGVKNDAYYPQVI